MPPPPLLVDCREIVVTCTKQPMLARNLSSSLDNLLVATGLEAAQLTSFLLVF